MQKILAEKSGVLNWLLDGHRDVMENPHIVRDLPAECVEAAEDLYRSMNLYQRWLDDETAPSDDNKLWMTVDGSWQGFTGWCHDQHEATGTKHKFGQALAVEGHPSVPLSVGTGKYERTVRFRTGLTWNPEHLKREDSEKDPAKDPAKGDLHPNEMRSETELAT